jgi:Ti-type conjugative transfer relaxase TraA
MAIFHLSAQIIKRSEGRSVVAAAAYRAADRFFDDRLGVFYDHRTKDGVVHREILAPDDVPYWAFDRELLWNKVEQRETWQTAQLAREVRLALPKELSDKQQNKLVRKFIRAEFVGRGMIADLCIHRDNPENPHAHILLTMRCVSKDGFGNKNRDWNRVEILKHWRQAWALAANRSLRRAGFRARISHLSHASRGLLTLPSIKLGTQRLKASAERRGFVLDRLKKTQRLLYDNGERIRQDPHIAFKELLYHESTFTRGQLREYLKSHTIDASQANACFDAVMTHPDLTSIGSDKRRAKDDARRLSLVYGKNKKQDELAAEVFTTSQTLADERSMLESAGSLIKASDKVSENGERLDTLQLQRLGTKLTLTDEQTAALIHVVDGSGKLAVVEGYAGTGKSRMFDAARSAWQNQGKRVLGTALAGKAAEELGRSANLADSRSLAAWEFAWDAGLDALTPDDVLIVDEAGMVGTRQMDRVLKRAEAVGAKVVLAGDTEQLQAVEAGCPFAAIGELVPNKACLATVRRQQADWQKEASVALAQGAGGVAIALRAYTAHDSVHTEFATENGVRAAIVTAWRGQELANKNVSQVALAYRRRDIPLLNAAIRDARLEAKAVSDSKMLQTDAGKKPFGQGDRIVFTKNSRNLDVRNGSLGTVERIGWFGKVTVRLDGPQNRQVTFKNRKWTHFDHGYAMSVHRSQGATVDRTHVLLSRAFDRHATYVAMTRHRERLDLYASTEEMRETDLGYMLSRERKKKMALDYLAGSQVAKGTNQARRPVAQQTKGPVPVPAPVQVTLSATPQTSKPAFPPQGPTRQELVAADRMASQALGSAERLAAKPLVSVQSALDRIPETQAARKALQEATVNRSFWRDAVAKAAQDRSWAKRLGLKSEMSLADPRTGVTMTVTQGRKMAEAQVLGAAADLKRLVESPEVHKQAKAFAREHNDPILKARDQIPALEQAFTAARRAKDYRGPAQTLAHDTSLEIDRGDLGR